MTADFTNIVLLRHAGTIRVWFPSKIGVSTAMVTNGLKYETAIIFKVISMQSFHIHSAKAEYGVTNS